MEYLFYLIILARISFIATEGYTIKRPWDSKDTFKFSSSLCTSDWKEKCQSMGGDNTWRNCTCKCSKGNNNVFGYFDNSWKCTSNEDVRQKYSECMSFQTFVQEAPSSVIRVAEPLKHKQQSIGTFESYKYCTYLGRQVSYLKCNGKWQRFNQNASVGFFLEWANIDILYYNDRDQLQQYKPTIFGRLIKLNVMCNEDDDGTVESHCVLLKVQGQQRCKVDLLPTTSHSTRTTTTQATQSSTAAQYTSLSATSQTTASKGSESLITTATSTATNHPTIHGTVSSIFPTGRTFNTTTHPAKSITNAPRKQKSEANGSDSSVGAIGGAVGGAATLIIILIIILIAILRRKKRYHEGNRESTTVSTDNPSYNNTIQIDGQLDLTDNEYSYAYTNNHPIAIKDQNGEAITGLGVHNGHITNVIGSPPEHEAPFYHSLEDTNCLHHVKSPDKQNGLPCNGLVNPTNTRTANHGPVYDVLEGPSNKAEAPNADGSIYNTLQDPNYSRLKPHIVDDNDPSAYNVLMRDQPINKQNGRVYDVRKDPNSSFNAHGDEAPTYEVLEEEQGPNKTQGPVYDTLENPNSLDGPVYNTLEEPNYGGQQALYTTPVEYQGPGVYGSLQDQDPNTYGHLYSPIWKRADNSINNDVYQELNQECRRSSHVYQPLGHKDNSIIMKNISGVNQSEA